MRFKSFLKKFSLPALIAGMVIGAGLTLGGNRLMTATSTNEYCMSCHIHTHADEAWTKSPHYHNASGIRTGCVDCHLPPKGSFKHLSAKVRTGLHDLYAFHFKDHELFDWERKRQLEHAVKIVYNESCVACHQELFPKSLSAEGGTAHLYYEQNAEKLNLQCINCHLDVGHFNPNFKHERLTGVPVASSGERELFKAPAEITRFENFTEFIPNTSVSFNMIAIPGGTFRMGSPDKEPLRNSDESPVREVTLSPFWMGEAEVSWNEFWSFYGATMSEGRVDIHQIMARNAANVDGISGPTPPFGIPEQVGAVETGLHNHYPLCRAGLLSVALERDRQKVPAPYRS